MKRFRVRLTLAFALFICGLVSFGTWIKLALKEDIDVQTVLVYRTPSVPTQFQGVVRYATNPADPDAEYITCEGQQLFLEIHRNSWRQCLEAFVRNYEVEHEDGRQAVWREGAKWPMSWLDVVPPGFDEPNKDGWNQCVAQIDEQLKTFSERELRKRLIFNALNRRRKHLLQFVIFVFTLLVTCVSMVYSRSITGSSTANEKKGQEPNWQIR